MIWDPVSTARAKLVDMKNVFVSIDSHVVMHDISEIWNDHKLDLPEPVWTGAMENGDTSQDTCDGWTSLDAFGTVAVTTISDRDDPCNQPRRLLCCCMTHL